MWLVLAKVFSSFTACIFAYLSIPLKKRFSLRAVYFKDLIRFGFPLQINDILGFINSRVDTLVVAALLGSAGIAFYEVARKIPDNLRLLYEPFRQVYYPFLAKWYVLDDKRQADRLVNDSMRFVAFFTLFGAAITVLFSRDIIRLFFSEKYLPSAPAFIVLMINLSIALVSNVMGTALVAVGDTQKPMIINFFNAIASWAGSILFIPAFGIFGAAIANTSGTALTYLPTVYFLRKKINFKNAAYLKPFFLFCAWGLLVFLIKPESFLLKTSFLCVFLIANVLLSIVTKADIALLVEGSGITSWGPLRKLGVWTSKL
jgi:O-antigen/teichoic acid export membrane protein